MTSRPARPLVAYSTATICDAMGKPGAGSALPGIRPLFDGARLFGRDYTVRYVTAG